jgi:hypothetical protein
VASTVGADATVRPVARESIRAAEDEGYGWVVFAGSMLSIAGLLNVIYGIAAISDSRFYARDVTYIISDLNTWGWALVLLGAVQFLSCFGILAQAAGVRWVGIFCAAGNAIIQMLVLPAAPLLALTLFAIDVLIIYGLVAHGRRPAGA